MKLMAHIFIFFMSRAILETLQCHERPADCTLETPDVKHIKYRTNPSSVFIEFFVYVTVSSAGSGAAAGLVGGSDVHVWGGSPEPGMFRVIAALVFHQSKVNVSGRRWWRKRWGRGRWQALRLGLSSLLWFWIVPVEFELHVTINSSIPHCLERVGMIRILWFVAHWVQHVHFKRVLPPIV